MRPMFRPKRDADSVMINSKDIFTNTLLQRLLQRLCCKDFVVAACDCKSLLYAECCITTDTILECGMILSKCAAHQLEIDVEIHFFANFQHEHFIYSWTQMSVWPEMQPTLHSNVHNTIFLQYYFNSILFFFMFDSWNLRYWGDYIENNRLLTNHFLFIVSQ